LNDQTGRLKAMGRLFTLNGVEASKSKDLIQGKCFTSGNPLLVLFDSDVIHSFTSSSCVEKLKFFVSSFNGDLVVKTPTSGYVLTSDVCLNCPVEIFGRKLLIDHIGLPLTQIDVILGMGWLSSNHVLLNYFDKIVVLGDSEVSRDRMFISVNQVVTSLKEYSQVYMILCNLELKTKVSISDLLVVREFPEDISDLLPKRER